MTDSSSAAGGNGATEAPAQVQFNILGQYLRDLSFENPNAPASLTLDAQPKIDIGVDVQARRANEDRFEVELKVRATAVGATDAKAVFVVELSYCGLFLIRNVPEEALQPFCLIECPRLLFPFARRIVADATRDGGFPPLLLDPIDFVALYRQQIERAQAAAAQQAQLSPQQ